MKPVIVIDAEGLEPGEEDQLLEMFIKAIQDSNSPPNPPDRIKCHIRVLTLEENVLIGILAKVNK
jgi:hypothetical protein